MAINISTKTQTTTNTTLLVATLVMLAGGASALMATALNPNSFNPAAQADLNTINHYPQAAYRCADNLANSNPLKRGSIVVTERKSNLATTIQDSCSANGLNVIKNYCLHDSSLGSADSQTFSCASFGGKCVDGACVPSNNKILPLVIVAATFPAGNANSTETISSGKRLATFKITNNSRSKITVTDLKFTDLGVHSGSGAAYRLFYSDQNSDNYNGNFLISRSPTLDFSNLPQNLPIDAQAYRYVSIIMDSASGLLPGDTFKLSVAQPEDIKFTVTEADLGYDYNNDGDFSDVVPNLPVSGTPVVVGQIKNAAAPTN